MTRDLQLVKEQVPYSLTVDVAYRIVLGPEWCGLKFNTNHCMDIFCDDNTWLFEQNDLKNNHSRTSGW